MNTQNVKYAAFLDIDNTLMGKSPKALEKNLSVIQKVRALGHKVYINTGRATAYMPENIDTEKFFDGVISGAGARIIMDKEEVFCKPVPYADIKVFCQYPFSADNYGVLEGVGRMFCVGHNGGMYTWPVVTGENMCELVPEDTQIEKFTVHGKAEKALSDSLGDGFVTLQHEYYAEIIQKDVTKANGMRFVLDKLGYSPEQSIAMGDSLNDFDMIESAGIGVAMGNAIKEIKDIATLITSDVDESGVAEAFIKILNL